MEKTKDGLRIYGSWAGNPTGHKEDVTRCIESVYGNERGAIPHQCDRKRGHGEDGLYCKQHDPNKVKAAAADRTARYEAENAVTNTKSDVWDAAEEVFRSQVGAGWELEQQRRAIGKLVAAYGAFERAKEHLKKLRG